MAGRRPRSPRVSPFTRPDQRMVPDAATDSVTIQTVDGDPVETLATPRAAFRECCTTAPGMVMIPSAVWVCSLARSPRDCPVT